MTTAAQQALWANQVMRDCLLEAGEDVNAALVAAEHILAVQPTPLPDDPPISAYFSDDIANHRAQVILNKALRAAKKLSAAARIDLEKALAKAPTDNGIAILEFIEKYRMQLATLLTATQLAAVLEGAREVAIKVKQLEDDAEQLGEAPLPTFPAEETIHLHTIEAAAKALAEKNVLTRQEYDALDAAARTKAFTVAGVDAQETLTKIRDALAENVKEGVGYASFRKKVLEAVDEGTFLSDAHQETVFRTNVQSAFSDGQMSLLSNPLVRSGFPYSAYDSIHDNRVRKEHLALDTLGIDGSNIYRTDDPVFQMFRPPWDFNCRCSWTPMTVQQAAERGIAEAKEWLSSGLEPAKPAFVSPPPFAPPPGFQRALGAAPLSIRLSLTPLRAYGAFPEPSRIPTEVSREEYPRNHSNQFVDKYDIVAAANDHTVLEELQQTVPEDQWWKLEKCVALLVSGGTVHHPDEPSGLGVDIDGRIPYPEWDDYAWRLAEREDWVARDNSRTERRKLLDKVIKSLRANTSKFGLDEVDVFLKEAGADNSELRLLARARYKVEVRGDSAEELEDVYESVVEAIYQRIEQEEAADIEPDAPEEPTSQAFAVDVQGHTHRGKGSEQGGQFTAKGVGEGDITSSRSMSRRRRVAQHGTVSGKPPSKHIPQGKSTIYEGLAPTTNQQKVNNAAPTDPSAFWAAGKVAPPLPPGTSSVINIAINQSAVAQSQLPQMSVRPQPPPSDTDDDLQKIATELASAPITSLKPVGTIGKELNGSYDVTVGGLRAMWKPADEEERSRSVGRIGAVKGTFYKREAATYSVAKVLNLTHLVPVTVEKDYNGRVGSVQHWKEDAQAAKFVLDKYDGDEDLSLSAAFDFLICNTDRHEGNWMVGNADGKLTLIDHGLNFPTNELDHFDSELFARAMRKKMPVPDVVNSWDEGKILAELEAHGIEEDARNQVAERLSYLKIAASSKRTFRDLKDDHIGYF